LVNNYFSNNRNDPLLVSETVLPPAVRTAPGNAVAGEIRDILGHAVLADGKAAPTSPAEGWRLPAAMANPVLPPSPAVTPLKTYIFFFR